MISPRRKEIEEFLRDRVIGDNRYSLEAISIDLKDLDCTSVILSSLKSEERGIELKLKYLSLSKLITFNNPDLHDIIAGCKNTLESLEVKDDLKENGTVFFLKMHLPTFTFLKRLKVLDLSAYSVIRPAHPSLESLEMQCAYYIERRMT